MLTFDLSDGGRLRIFAPSVEAVAEMDVRKREGERAVAEIVLRSGARYLVHDPERSVMEQIAAAVQQADEAQEKQRHEARNNSTRLAKALEALGVESA